MVATDVDCASGRLIHASSPHSAAATATRTIPNDRCTSAAYSAPGLCRELTHVRRELRRLGAPDFRGHRLAADVAAEVVPEDAERDDHAEGDERVHLEPAAPHAPVVL